MKPGNQTSCGTRLLFWEGIDLGQWSVSLPGFKRQCLSRSSGCLGDEIVVWWPDRRRLLLKRGGLSARPRTRAGVVSTRSVPTHVPVAHVPEQRIGRAWAA